MQAPQLIDYETQIEEAAKRAKCKKVLYLYDEMGNKSLLGIFNKRRALEIKKQLSDRNMINRLSEFEIRTTEPDSEFKLERM
ncbi:MAG: hypothetical protein JXB23_00065 [Candidatus Aminicenantes bacterium]|nr:hypothetical protein [Candidatus Aminicenantes bacterium]